MSQTSEINLPEEYAEDWIPRLEEDGEPEQRLPERLHLLLGSGIVKVPERITLTAPNGTQVEVEPDPITGGLRITQVQADPDSPRGMLSAVPMGLGSLLLDDRE